MIQCRKYVSLLHQMVTWPIITKVVAGFIWIQKCKKYALHYGLKTCKTRRLCMDVQSLATQINVLYLNPSVNVWYYKIVSKSKNNHDKNFQASKAKRRDFIVVEFTKICIENRWSVDFFHTNYFNFKRP